MAKKPNPADDPVTVGRLEGYGFTHSPRYGGCLVAASLSGPAVRVMTINMTWWSGRKEIPAPATWGEAVALLRTLGVRDRTERTAAAERKAAKTRRAASPVRIKAAAKAKADAAAKFDPPTECANCCCQVPVSETHSCPACGLDPLCPGCVCEDCPGEEPN